MAIGTSGYFRKEKQKNDHWKKKEKANGVCGSCNLFDGHEIKAGFWVDATG